MRRKESGWWGDQRYNTSDRLSGDDLKSTLAKMSSKMLLCSISESISGLDSPGVYMYINKFTKKMYIGSAVGQTILRRQQQHLCSASRKKGQVGKFDLELSKCFNAAEWDFLAQPMKKEILNEERELILKYRSYIDQIGYNTQVPGGY